MKDITSIIPNIEVIYESNYFKIDTLQSYRENEWEIVISAADHIENFKRGFLCDMKLEYLVRNNVKETEKKYEEYISDLLLVRINKEITFDSLPVWEYVFLKS